MSAVNVVKKSQWGTQRNSDFDEFRAPPNPSGGTRHAAIGTKVPQQCARDAGGVSSVVGASLASTSAKVGVRKGDATAVAVAASDHHNYHQQQQHLEFASPLLQRRFGGPRNATRARALLKNDAVVHAMEMMKSESARVDARLLTDFDQVLAGQCVYLPSFICDAKDETLYNKLQDDLLEYVKRQKLAEQLESPSGKAGSEESTDLDAPTTKKEGGQEQLGDSGAATRPQAVGVTDVTKDDVVESLSRVWSKHQIFENPEGISTTFQEIIAALEEYFCVEVYATRLNYYRDGSSWKPFHHDSHAYGGRALREDFTMGISLGATRALSFLHEPSGRVFDFPQHNGDMFAFTNEVNTRFMHGVPRASHGVGERFSIIAWGRRREINARNGGSSSSSSSRAKDPSWTAALACEDGRQLSDGSCAASMPPPRSVNDAIAAAQDLVSMRTRAEPPPPPDAGGAQSTSTAVDAKSKKKKKNRLQ